MELRGVGMGADGPNPQAERMEQRIQRFDESSFGTPNVPGYVKGVEG
jgi:hypothetical protein